MASRTMYPTITEGSHLIVSKYGYGNYESFNIHLLKTASTNTTIRGDLIVFQHPKQPSINYLKRVVGLPGDKIIYKNKILYINGERVLLNKISKDQEYEILKKALKI